MRPIELIAITGVLLLGQVAPPDWTHMASLPFAFAVGAFLVWSLVQLLNLVFKTAAAKDSETLLALREQIRELRTFQQDTLVGMVREASSAMEKSAEAAVASTEAWGQVHDDFRGLIGEIRARPCLKDHHHERQTGNAS